MLLPDRKLTGAMRVATLAIFLGIALVIGFAERAIPLDIGVPGIKLGLSNIVILTLLYLFSPADVFTVVILRCVLTSAISGSAASFFYSLSGAVFSFFVMLFLIRAGKAKISPIGVSVAGAVFHNIGQILAAWLMLKSFGVVSYLPVLLISGVITGVITGVAVKYLRTHIVSVLNGVYKN